MAAEPRGQWLDRAHERYQLILDRRATGALWREIADELGMTMPAVLAAGRRAAEWAEREERDATQPQLFQDGA